MTATEKAKPALVVTAPTLAFAFHGDRPYVATICHVSRVRQLTRDHLMKFSIVAGAKRTVAVGRLAVGAQQVLAHAKNPYQPLLDVPHAAVAVVYATTAVASEGITIANTMTDTFIHHPPLPRDTPGQS